ncbi:beta strand repeat-containing protein [Vibrio sp.]|uniref:beta strand repeat-containing protein n=1 Tax=Vibrio sp. TaxID=678 RepID=UPI003D11111D
MISQFFKYGLCSVLSLGLLTGCGEDSGFPAQGKPGDFEGVVQSISVTPSQSQLALQEKVALKATVTFTNGKQQDVTSQAEWQSNNVTSVSVNEQGIVTGEAAGSAEIVASLDGISSEPANVGVSDISLTQLLLLPSSSTVTQGMSQEYKVTAMYSDGSYKDVTDAAGWAFQGDGIEVTETAGHFIASTVGEAQITASYSGMPSNMANLVTTAATVVSISVSPGSANLIVGTTQPFIAIAYLSDGSSKEITSQADWQSSNETVSSIDDNGLAAALATGNSQLQASFMGVTSSPVEVSVREATVMTVQITPANLSLAINASRPLLAIATFDDGTSRDVSADSTWTSTAPQIADVSNAGLVTAASVGNALITATFSGQASNIANVVVNAATVSSLQVTPGSARVAVGTQQPFKAIAIYSDGSSLDVSNQAGWQNSDSTVASLDQQGKATALKAGSANISATFQGTVSNSAAMTVTAATLNEIQVSPGSVNLANGTSRTLTATAIYSDNSSQDISSQANWQSNDTGIVTVDTQGNLQANGTGSTTVTASYQGVTSNSASVNVSAATLTSIQVSPGSMTLAKGTSGSLTATATFSDGTSQDVTDQVSWSSTDPNVATIGGGGTVTAEGQGTADIIATYLGQSSTGVVVTVTSATVDDLQLTPGSATVAKGTTKALKAVAVFSDGTSQDVTSQATWDSSNKSVATIEKGLASSLAMGSTVITAQFQGQTSNNGTLTVTAASVSSVQVTPGTASVANGTTAQFTAVATFSDGTTQDVTDQVSWNSTNKSVATIDGNGEASALAEGSSTITAVFGGVSSNGATMNVTAATITDLQVSPSTAAIAKGTGQAYTAVAIYSDGSNQNVTSQVTWYSSDSDIASISNSGQAQGLAEGTVTISASFMGENSNNASLTVTTATLSSVQVTPGSSSIAKGTTVNFVATAYFSDGTSQDITNQASWTSSNDTVATISTSGLVTGEDTGNTSIRATYDGTPSNAASLTVTDAQVVSVQLAPASSSVAKGNTKQLTATANYTDGSSQDVTSLASWSSSNQSVATVSPSGLADALDVGSTNITATYQTKVSNNAALSVTNATVTEVTVSPASVSIAKGTNTSFTATAHYSDNTTQDVTTIASWSSDDETVATISAGNAHAEDIGSAVINATYGAVKSSDANLTVTTATVSSILVTPTNASIALGTTQDFTATAIYTDGTTTDITNQASWASSDTGVATIESGGTATGQGQGSSVITASYQSKTSNDADLTVTAATVNSVLITPASPSIANGTNQPFTAIATFSDATNQDVTTQASWTSSNSSVATINSSGLAESVATGTSNIKATFSGIESNIEVLTVTNATVTDVSVTPSPIDVAKGAAVQLTATATFTDSSTQDVTSLASWSTGNTSIATVDNAGELTGVNEGTTTASARYEGVDSSPVTVNVTAAELMAITLHAEPGSGLLSVVSADTYIIALGDTAADITAIGEFTDGTTRPLDDSEVAYRLQEDLSLLSANADGTLNLTVTVVGTQTVGGESKATPIILSTNLIEVDCLANVPGVSAICTISSIPR